MLNEQAEIHAQEMARFGHTITPINESALLVFGGAIETSRGVYSTTCDSFLIIRESLLWKRVQSRLKRLRCNSLQPSSACGGLD